MNLREGVSISVALKKSAERIEQLFDRVEKRFFPPEIAPDWTASAYYWRRRAGGGHFEPVLNFAAVHAADLVGLEVQRQKLETNTRQFLRRLPCNDALLWGARGCGKSSLVRSLLTSYEGEGLRLVQIDANDFDDLPLVMGLLSEREEPFIIFIDDLSLAREEGASRTLKALLDGSVRARPANVVIYCTSNRRHLMKEKFSDNLAAKHVDGELHPGETVDENVSLSDRFGLSLSFAPFSQELYLSAVESCLTLLARERGRPSGAPAGVLEVECCEEALRWALARGNRSGRTAAHFARSWIGRLALEEK